MPLLDDKHTVTRLHELEHGSITETVVAGLKEGPFGQLLIKFSWKTACRWEPLQGGRWED